MINEYEVLSRIESVSAVQLRIWITEEWVKPAYSEMAMAFNEADIARIRLLDMLHNQLQVSEDAISIILSLIDQVHDLKTQMRLISEAIDAQPNEVRARILNAIRQDETSNSDN